MKKLKKRTLTNLTTIQKFSCSCGVRCQCIRPEWGWQSYQEMYQDQTDRLGGTNGPYSVEIGL